MRSSTLLTAALAAGALGSPLDRFFKRDAVTNYAYVTTTVYVTAGAAPVNQVATTAAAAATTTRAWPNWGGYHHRSRTTTVVVPAGSSAPASSAAPVESSTPAPEPTSTEEPEQPTSTDVPPPPASSSEAPEAPATTQTPSPVSSQPATYAAGNGPHPTYTGNVVNHHNVHRSNHSAGPVSWDDGLYRAALALAQNCVYQHNTDLNGGGYGQNIAAGVEENKVADIITGLFYNGEAPKYTPFYGQATPNGEHFNDTFHLIGHFSQIVWKGTTKVGCATYDCSHSGKGTKGLDVAPGEEPFGTDMAPIFTVCNYSPPGNWLGQFAKNVAQPKGNPTVYWDSSL